MSMKDWLENLEDRVSRSFENHYSVSEKDFNFHSSGKVEQEKEKENLPSRKKKLTKENYSLESQ